MAWQSFGTQYRGTKMIMGLLYIIFSLLLNDEVHSVFEVTKYPNSLSWQTALQRCGTIRNFTFAVPVVNLSSMTVLDKVEFQGEAWVGYYQTYEYFLFLERHNPMLLSDSPYNWTEAKHWCSRHVSEFGDKILNASFLFSHGYCEAGCIWTRNVIQVQLQAEIAPLNNEGECGILHNGTISFTSCIRHLHPLCERVTKTALETPLLSFSEENNSCILRNNTKTYTTTTEASRRTNRIHATIITSSTTGTSTVANEITKLTTIGLNENNSSVKEPVVATTARNDLEDTHHKSDTGIIIRAVTGNFVFLMMTFLGIVCIRRRLLQRIGEKKSKHDGKNTKMHNTDTIDHNQCHDIPLESGSGFIVIAQLESNNEESHSSIFGLISDLRKPASFLDPEGSKFNYETLTRKVNVNSSNPNSNIDYDSYENLNSLQEGRDDIFTRNIYDTVKFE